MAAIGLLVLISMLVGAMENSQVFTTRVTRHTDHMAKDHRQKGGVPRDCDRQPEAILVHATTSKNVK